MDAVLGSGSHWSAVLSARGVGFASLGAAYLALLLNVSLAAAGYVAARAHLVISPNRAARDYGMYVTAVLVTLLIATVLENELLPSPAGVLQYVAAPHLLLLLLVHLAICYRQEPWLIALGAAALGGALLTAALLALGTSSVRAAHGFAGAALAALLALLAVKSISTKRGFIRAKSIYISSKETLDAAATPQKPWLGLPHWLGLAAGSALLAAANSVLGGARVAEIPALEVAFQAGLLLAATALLCAVPAGTYWLARRNWMPDLTRFAWLVWLVVGFAFTYGNYLSRAYRV
jgi:hypothetical protein